MWQAACSASSTQCRLQCDCFLPLPALQEAPRGWTKTLLVRCCRLTAGCMLSGHLSLFIDVEGSYSLCTANRSRRPTGHLLSSLPELPNFP
jgi:hypothetical protein